MQDNRPSRRRCGGRNGPEQPGSLAPLGPGWTLGFSWVLLAVASGIGCAGGTTGAYPDAGPPPDATRDDAGEDRPPASGALEINELCPDDDGFQIDEVGQTDDWIEVRNAGATPIDLRGWTLAQGNGQGHPLPAQVLAAGQTLLLWADATPAQGPRHLGFKLPAGGGQVRLRDPAGAVVDQVAYPALETNVAFGRFPDGAAGFTSCRYATPGRANGERCGPPPPVGLPPEVQFAPFAWPPGWSTPRGVLRITQAALRPARSVEITSAAPGALALDEYELRLAPHEPGQPWPGPDAGVALRWPQPAATIAPGARVTVALAPADVAAVAATPAFEGVLTLFRRASGEVVQRLDFVDLPEGSVLALVPAGAGSGELTYRLCRDTSGGGCTPWGRRALPDRARRLHGDEDLEALADGGDQLDSLGVKVVVDMEAGDVVHFLSARRWPLHYTFVRERIYREPPLDRCNPQEAALFDAGWREFSNREYFQTEGRRFLLGTLVRYGGSGSHTLEFDRGDEITAEQMRRAFFAVAARLPRPPLWAVRAQGGRQVTALKAIEGTLPLLEPNAPFRGVSFQPLTPGVGYGVLRFVPAGELAAARLGVDVIVVTDDVPNDVPLIGGLVTESFQTPLSHVGVLTRNRGTPNMALTGARADARLAPLFDKLVRLEVAGGTWTVAQASAAEAQAFWEQRRPRGPRVVPRLDRSLRGLVDLRQRSLDDLPAIGAKAAQLAELMRVVSTDFQCAGPIPTPPVAYALPVAHGLDHFEASGARRIFDGWRARPEFAADPRVRGQALAEVRQAILSHPVEPALATALRAQATATFGTARFRLRSSSNTEDLPGFTGAGLYTSLSAAIGDPERTPEDGLRAVWASLWSERAYDERELGNIDQTGVAMGVLIHEAYHDVERANGVAVSRDIRNPIHASVHYINAQAGEAAVTNPAPGVTSEEMTYAWWRVPPTTLYSRSSLTAAPVLRPDEIERIACAMRAVHAHFQVRLDPLGKNRWFTMESEFKLVGPGRTLILKQARPYSFGPVTIPVDCREI